jgi:hypothetical protein
MIHFEELWEKCEEFNSNNSYDESILDIIDELTMKLNLYSMIDQKSDISSEDKNIAKSRIMGEILLSITSISLKDNINVFDALHTALMQRNISIFSNKYSD